MGAVTIQQMADRVAALMEERLRMRGVGLTEKLRKGRRVLPRRVRAAADQLAAAAAMAQNPKLLLQVDEAMVAQNYDICIKHLSGMNAWARRRGAMAGVAGSIAFSLLVVAALVVAVLVWRGYV